MRILLLAVALAACAPSAAPPSVPSPPASDALAPPTPEGVAVHVVQAQDGQSVTVPVGQKVSIELVGVPTAGYVWQIDALPDFLTRSGEASGPTIEAQRHPGYVGGSHWEVFVLTANAPGQGVVRLAQRRPWESSEPPSQTFSVTIVAQ